MKSVLLLALILIKYCIAELECGYSEDEENDIIYFDVDEFKSLPNWIFIVPDVVCSFSKYNAVFTDKRTKFKGESNYWRCLHRLFQCFQGPRTKWCGSGNIAGGYDELGIFKKTDTCCRAHDYCEDVIPGYETKYNLTNPYFYSRLSCECDEAFYNCLKDVSSIISLKVGYLYFNILGTQCFREDYPAVCVKYSCLPLRKCVKYKYDESQQKIYQWFDVPRY